jgi:diacylglycerol kinase (ATP)
MKPPLLIVNPTCGSRTTTKSLPQILGAVERTLGDVAIRYTACRGHAMELAFEGAREGHPLIVAVGGDGTLSEVANGVLRAADPPVGAAPEPADGAGPEPPAQEPAASPAVGLINVGTGGDFRRSLGIGAGYERSLEALALGRERFVDVGQAVYSDSEGKETARYFVNVLSAGLGGLVDRYIEEVPGAIGGKAGYYLASLRAVLASKERPVLARVTWQGETREEVIPAYLIAICNGRWFGGGMDIAPMALPDDGRLEVVTITERSKLSLIRKMRLIYDGRHLEVPTVGHFPCERIELSLENKKRERTFLLDVDGDPLGSLPLSVEIQPRRLKIRA